MANRQYSAFLSVLLLFAFGGLTAVTRAQDPPTTRQRTVGAADVQMSDKDERYRIGPGDVLEVIVYNHPQLSRPVLRVDGRGMIRLPLLEGEILAACKTESELASDLTTRYLEYQKYPQVDVYVKEFNSQPIAILGAVRSAGRFQLQRRVRLLELLTYAGGPAPNAGRTIQIVHNSGAPQLCSDQKPSEQKPIENSDDSMSFYPIKDTLRGVEAANPFLTSGDIVFLPDADQVFVTGNVAKPSAIPMQEPVTLSHAIMIAGGLLPGSQSKVRVVRQDMTTLTRTEQYIDIKEVNKGIAKDIVLQPNDVVEVLREGGAKSVLKAIMGAMIPTAALLPTRILY
jgi:polysaccharide export outer membrane protein